MLIHSNGEFRIFLVGFWKRCDSYITGTFKIDLATIDDVISMIYESNPGTMNCLGYGQLNNSIGFENNLTMRKLI